MSSKRGGAGAGRGKKIQHKGRHRHFTTEEELQQEQQRNQGEGRRGGESDSDDGVRKITTDTARQRLRDSDDSEDDDGYKSKGVHHLIETSNPNRVPEQTKKASELNINDVSTKPTYSRKEREEIEKQQQKERYQKLHAEGKTSEAQADMARLALIRQQREEAAKKRVDEKAAKELERISKVEAAGKKLDKNRGKKK